MNRLSWGIDLEKVPWSLWAYVATTGVNLIILLARLNYVKPAIFVVVVATAWDYFLLRAVRWLWIATVVSFALIIIINLVTGSGTWWGSALGLLQLCLLLLSPTRRFFESRTA
jgi:hypothetical protein